MNAEALIVNKVRERLGSNVSLLWNDVTKALVMQHPVFRFTIVDWHVWSQFMGETEKGGSNYDEYATHIALSFAEAITLTDIVDKLATLQETITRMEV